MPEAVEKFDSLHKSACWPISNLNYSVVFHPNCVGIFGTTTEVASAIFHLQFLNPPTSPCLVTYSAEQGLNWGLETGEFNEALAQMVPCVACPWIGNLSLLNCFAALLLGGCMALSSVLAFDPALRCMQWPRSLVNSVTSRREPGTGFSCAIICWPRIGPKEGWTQGTPASCEVPHYIKKAEILVTSVSMFEFVYISLSISSSAFFSKKG